MGQQLKQNHIGVAFDGIKRMHSRQFVEPVVVFGADVVQINNVKWIIFDALKHNLIALFKQQQSVMTFKKRNTEFILMAFDGLELKRASPLS